MKLCQFSHWSSRKLFAAFLPRSVALVVHLRLNISHQSFQFYVVESSMAFLWYFCGFREGTADYFLYWLIKLAIGILADNRD